MKKEISLYEFKDAFAKVNSDNFSYEGYEALYNYLDGSEEFIFNPIEVAMRYKEFSDLDSLLDNHAIDSLKELRGLTEVIKFSKGYIIDTDF